MRQLQYIIISFFIACGCVNAQTIAGYVYNAADNLPLEGAVVYLDGTTYSASTNSKGYFSITTTHRLPAALVITFVGFKPLRVEEPFSYNKPFKFLLEEDAVSMDEVVIKGNTLFSRKQMMKVFKEQFLGTTKAGSSCVIENEDDIILRFETSTNTLYAESASPLIITNKYLKYKIRFDLAVFRAGFTAKTLNSERLKNVFFGGTTLFTDISLNNSAAKQRKEAYLGSAVHFAKTVATEDWQKQKFQLYLGGWPVDPKKHFIVTDTLSYKKVTIVPPKVEEATITMVNNGQTQTLPAKPQPAKFNIFYKRKEQSYFEYDKGYFYVDDKGLFWPIWELTFGGEIAKRKAGDMLPADYDPML